MGLEEGFKFKKKKQNKNNLRSPDLRSENKKEINLDEKKKLETDKTYEGEVEIYGIDVPSSKAPQEKQSTIEKKKPPKLKIPIVKLKDM